MSDPMKKVPNHNCDCHPDPDPEPPFGAKSGMLNPGPHLSMKKRIAQSRWQRCLSQNSHAFNNRSKHGRQVINPHSRHTGPGASWPYDVSHDAPPRAPPAPSMLSPVAVSAPGLPQCKAIQLLSNEPVSPPNVAPARSMLHYLPSTFLCSRGPPSPAAFQTRPPRARA